MRKIAPTPLYKFPMNYGRSSFLDVIFVKNLRQKNVLVVLVLEFLWGIFKDKIKNPSHNLGLEIVLENH